MEKLSTVEILDVITKDARKKLGLSAPDRQKAKHPRNARPTASSSDPVSQEGHSQEGFSQELSFNPSPPLEVQTQQIIRKRELESAKALKRAEFQRMSSKGFSWKQAMIAKEVLDPPLSKRK